MQFFLSAIDSWVLAKSVISDEQKAYELTAQAILLTHVPADAAPPIPTDLIGEIDKSAASLPDTVVLSELLALLESEISIPPTVVIPTLIDALHMPMDALAAQLKAPESLLKTYLSRGRAAGHSSKALAFHNDFVPERMQAAAAALPKAQAGEIRAHVKAVKAGQAQRGAQQPGGAIPAPPGGGNGGIQPSHTPPAGATGFETPPISLSDGQAAQRLSEQSTEVGASTYAPKTEEPPAPKMTEIAGMQFAFVEDNDLDLDLPPFPLAFNSFHDAYVDPKTIEANLEARLAADSRDKIQQEFQIQKGPDGTYVSPSPHPQEPKKEQRDTVVSGQAPNDYFADIADRPNLFTEQPPKGTRFDTGFSVENGPNHGFMSQTYPDRKPLLRTDEVVLVSRNVGPGGIASSTTLIRPQKERSASFKGVAEHEEQNSFALAFIIVFVTLFIGVLVFILVYALGSRTSNPDTAFTPIPSESTETPETFLSPQATPVAPGQLVIGDMHILRGVEELATVATTFPKTELLSFVVDYSKAAENDNVTAVTLKDGQEIHRELVWLNPWLISQQFLADPNKLYFDVGSYEIQIIQNNEVVKTISFTITE